MNKIVLICFCCALLFSCKQKKAENSTRSADTARLINANMDTASAKKDMHYFWEVNLDDRSNDLHIKKVRPIPADSLTRENMIMQLNNMNPDVKLEFVKISNDTIFLKIRNSNFLTKQMGSTGADKYLTEVTYNLTELQNINHVYLNFKEGEHASPGNYARTDFVNIRE